MLFYGRTAILTIGDVIFAGRISFEIKKEYSGAAPCEIKAYNLSPSHRSAFESMGPNALKVYLSAGYGGINKLVYAGAVLYAESPRVGPDIITSFHCSTAIAALHQASATLSGNLTDLDVVRTCVMELGRHGVVQGHISPGVESILRGGTYTRGYADVSYVSKILDDVTKRHGLTWYIDSGAVNIHFKDEFADSELLVLSPTSGMIGFPTKTQVTGCYKVRALLNADLAPGKRIRIESTQLKLKGDVRVIKSTFMGDTLEGDWYTEVEAMDLHVAPNISGAVDG